MTRRVRIIRAIRAGVFGQTVQTALQLASVPLFVLHWGAERYGLWLMISTIPAYLLVSDFGIGRTATSEVTMRFARGAIDDARQVYETVLLCMCGIVALVFSLAVMAIWLSPDHWFSGMDGAVLLRQRETITCITAYGAVILCGSLLSPGFQATGNYAREVWLASSLWLVEGIVTIAVLVSHGDMLQVAISLLACRTIGFSVQAYSMRRTAKWLRFGFRNARLSIVRELWRSSIANMTIPAANALFLQGTALAVGWGASPTAVPAFVVSRSLTRFALQLSNGVTRSTTPEFAAAFAINDLPAQRKLMLATTAAGLAIGILFGFGLALFGIPIVEFWTAGRVTPSDAMMLMLAFSLMLSSIWIPMNMLIVATNRQGLLALPLLGAALAGVLIAYLGSLELGSIAGAMGMLVVDLCMMAVSFKLVGDLFGSRREFLKFGIQTSRLMLRSVFRAS